MAQRFFALVVGINQYQSDEVRDLQGCVKDAESVRDMLLQSHKDAEVWVLRDASATQVEIIRAFNENLINNPNIIMNDPIVVYFACKGRRLSAPPEAQERDLDVLVPHDYCDEVPGIADITIHALLCELAQKKGTNVTVILDSSFCTWIPRGGKVAHRSETSSIPPSHVAEAYGDSAQYGGFFSESATPYVLLMACRQNELAWESSDGGDFTQDILTRMREKDSLTYRELVIIGDDFEFRKQHPICSGLQPDRLLFSIPTEARISALRVFFDAPEMELEAKAGNDFVRVEKKEEASIAIRSAPYPYGGTIVERLDGLVGIYAGRHIHASASPDSIPFMLDTIAHFNHYLALDSLCPGSSSLRGRGRQTTPPGVEVYHFRCNEAGVIQGQKSRNQLRNGVARIYSLPENRRFALKIINSSSYAVYPYVICFNPANYIIQGLYTPSPNETRQLPLKPGRFFTLGFGKNGVAPLQLEVDPIHKNRDALFFKVFLCEKPVDLRCMLQPHSLTVSLPSHLASNANAAIAAEIPGLWMTEISTISTQLGPRWMSRWKTFVENLHLRFSSIRWSISRAAPSV
ncbi:hypothetical protein FB451DRAFT_448110 [Mycena latifolia]|nr:hypothetical protein FB451DRAFT_448110 [Mycena latifolia]